MSMDVYPDGFPDEPLNMSNGNAEAVFAALGIEIETDQPSEIDPDVLISAIDNASLPPATPTRVSSQPGKATLIICGRDQGYYAERFLWLRQIALAAKQNGVKVIVA